MNKGGRSGLIKPQTLIEALKSDRPPKKDTIIATGLDNIKCGLQQDSAGDIPEL